MSSEKDWITTAYRRLDSRYFDVVVYALLAFLGLLQFVFYQRGSEFYSGDTSYLELARSLALKGSYSFDFRPETMLPPGFPLMLAAVGPVLGWSHSALVRFMPIFSTLGFMAAYQLLRRDAGRVVAAGVCLILDSSRPVFWFATTMVY